MHAQTQTHRSPRLGWGLALVAVFWSANWALEGLRTHLLFFPLWLGYILVFDGLCLRRTGTSLLSRAGRDTPRLFWVSIPVWWLFELFNLRLGNWEYVGREHFSAVEYFILCSISFSTVLPAVLVTAEWVRGHAWIERFAQGPEVRPTPSVARASILAGVAMLAATVLWPTYCYPLIWVGGVFLLEGVCIRLGRASLLTSLGRGDWRPWMSLWCGVLICAFFWEMWNVDSYPKWIYHIPGLGFWKLFEMPALGYLGYLPFALEIFLLKELLLPSRAAQRL